MTNNIELKLDKLENVNESNEIIDNNFSVSNEFTDEELAQINEFSEKINMRDSNQILNYGSSAQKKSTAFSEAALKGVKTKEFGEIGSLLSQLTSEIRGFGETDRKGLAGFFQNKVNKIEAIRSKYATSEKNINKIVEALDTHQFTLLKDISIMDKLYEQNKDYYKELTMYIFAGKKKLEDVRTGELAELQKKANETKLAEDVQEARDLSAMCDRFEKKIHDLEITKTITLQTAPQIRMIQEDDAIMAEKIQSTLNNTIPLWKNQMVLSLGIAHADEAAKAQKLVTDATNEMIKQNASKLRQATVNAAIENERSIVDIETLQHTNNQLIATVDEVLKIQEEGQTRRREAERELVRIEDELKQKMIEASSK